MRYTTLTIAVLPTLALLTACGDEPHPFTPTTHASAPTFHRTEPTSGSHGKKIRILDDCEPASFNAAIGPGTCVGDGQTTFAEFIAELTEEQAIDSWEFEPDEFGARAGAPLRIVNRGGETHTFTKVAAFGGGFLALLNTLSGNPTPRPECARVLANGSLAPQPPSPTNLFVLAGGAASLDAALLPAGRHRFMCCIHPWMRTTVDVRTRQGDRD